MSIPNDLVGELSQELHVCPELLARLLRRLIEERKGRGCVDVGGLRGSWRADRVVIEKYVAVEGATPQEILNG